MRKTLIKGDRVQLWPKDTFGKYAIVREVAEHSVTFEITWVESGEKFYKIGDKITLPKSHIFMA